MIDPNIPWQDYCQIKRMNPSTLVAGCKSMLRLKRCIDGGYPEETNAMRFGTGIHALLLEPDQFADRFCVMPDFHLDVGNVTGKGEKSESKATSYYKERVREFARSNSGKSFLTQTQFDDAMHCIGALRRRPAIAKIMNNCLTEVTVFGEIDGVEFKGRLDILCPGMIVDLKTTGDIAPRAFGRTFANLHYAFKLAIYRELVRQSTSGLREVKIIAQEASGDFDNCLIPIPDIILDNAFTQVKRVVSDYKRCLESDTWPGVDRGADEVELYLPQWAMEDGGDDVVEFAEVEF